MVIADGPDRRAECRGGERDRVEPHELRPHDLGLVLDDHGGDAGVVEEVGDLRVRAQLDPQERARLLDDAGRDPRRLDPDRRGHDVREPLAQPWDVLEAVEQRDHDAGLRLDALDSVGEARGLGGDEEHVDGLVEPARRTHRGGPIAEDDAAQPDLLDRRAADDERVRQHGGQQPADAAWSKHGNVHRGRNVLRHRL